MKAKTLETSLDGLELVLPGIERDPPVSLRWLEGTAGRDTLRLMGNADDQNKPSTLDAERKRTQEFIESEDQLTWMMQYRHKIVGAVWVDLKETDYLPGPSIHIMIGDPAVRGQGIGTYSMNAVVDYLRMNSYDTVYSRHLVENKPAAGLLKVVGFIRLGEVYQDADGLRWQNESLELTQSQEK